MHIVCSRSDGGSVCLSTGTEISTPTSEQSAFGQWGSGSHVIPPISSMAPTFDTLVGSSRMPIPPSDLKRYEL